MGLSSELTPHLNAMERFCAYQERSTFEIKCKLRIKGLSEKSIDEVLQHLNATNFLNERRFAMAYVQGKSSIKRWGVNKIQLGLQKHQISPELIKEALNSISLISSQEQLKDWFDRKIKALEREPDGPKKKAKIVRFLLGKGFPIQEILPLF